MPENKTKEARDFIAVGSLIKKSNSEREFTVKSVEYKWDYPNGKWIKVLYFYDSMGRIGYAHAKQCKRVA